MRRPTHPSSRCNNRRRRRRPFDPPEEMSDAIAKELISFCEDQPVFCAAFKKHDGGMTTQELDEHCATFKDARACDRSTALHCAAAHGNEHVVSYLLQRCPELLDMKIYDGRTPLHCAALAGQERVVAQLLSASPGLIDAHTFSGCTALHYAAYEGHEAVVAHFLAISPTAAKTRAKYDRLPHHFAAHSGHERVVAQLLAADPNLIEAVASQPENTSVWTAFDFAVKQGHVGVVTALLAANPEFAEYWRQDWGLGPALLYAAHEGYEAVVRALLAANPDLIRATDLFRNNVLHKAIESSLLPSEFIGELSRFNPDLLLSVNNCDLTPFDVALSKQNDSVIALLQRSLTFDVAFSLHKTYAEERLRPVLEEQCEDLSCLLLLPDVVGVVFEFLGLERTKRHKRVKLD